jgi:hypothetical protein
MDLDISFVVIEVKFIQGMEKSVSIFENIKRIHRFTLLRHQGPNLVYVSPAGFPTYEIACTFKHPTYGIRKLMELGSIVHGSKGYFVDYAASIASKYLPIAQSMNDSFKISITNSAFNKTASIRSQGERM